MACERLDWVFTFSLVRSAAAGWHSNVDPLQSEQAALLTVLTEGRGALGVLPMSRTQ